MNAKLSESVAVVGIIDPDVYGAGARQTTWVNMGEFKQLMGIIEVGDLGTNATLDGKFEQATDDAGTGAKDVAGTDMTQLTQAGVDDSNKQVVINCRGEELDVDNGFAYARLSMTVGTASSDCGAVLLGGSARYQPASDNDATTVAEIVN